MRCTFRPQRRHCLSVNWGVNFMIISVITTGAHGPMHGRIGTHQDQTLLYKAESRQHLLQVPHAGQFLFAPRASLWPCRVNFAPSESNFQVYNSHSARMFTPIGAATRRIHSPRSQHWPDPTRYATSTQRSCCYSFRPNGVQYVPCGLVN